MDELLREDIYADVFDTLKTAIYSSESLEAQVRRLTTKIMMHFEGRTPTKQPVGEESNDYNAGYAKGFVDGCPTNQTRKHCIMRLTKDEYDTAMNALRKGGERE